MKTLYVLYIKTTKGNILFVEVRGHMCFSTGLKSLFCSGKVLWTNTRTVRSTSNCVKYLIILTFSLFIAAENWAAWTQWKRVHVIYYVWQVFPGLHLVPFRAVKTTTVYSLWCLAFNRHASLKRNMCRTRVCNPPCGRDQWLTSMARIHIHSTHTDLWKKQRIFLHSGAQNKAWTRMVRCY